MPGRSTWRTTTFWFATPITAVLVENLTSDHSFLIAAVTALRSMTSPSRTAPGGNDTCPNFSSLIEFLPTDNSAARTADVPISRPTAVRPATTVLSYQEGFPAVPRRTRRVLSAHGIGQMAAGLERDAAKRLLRATRR